MSNSILGRAPEHVRTNELQSWFVCEHLEANDRAP